MIHGKTNSIPKLRRHLPLVNQSRLFAQKKIFDIRFRLSQMAIQRVRISHIQYTLRKLLTCRCLAAPFWSFYQNRANPLKLSCQKSIYNPFSIFFSKFHE